MFTDMVWYTAFKGEDETSAYQLLKKNRQRQIPLIDKYSKWLKEMGNGTMAQFDSAWTPLIVLWQFIELDEQMLRPT